MEFMSSKIDNFFLSLGGAVCARKAVLEIAFPDFKSWDEVVSFGKFYFGKIITKSFEERDFVPNTAFFANLKKKEQLFAFYRVKKENIIEDLLEASRLFRKFSGVSLEAPSFRGIDREEYGLKETLDLAKALVAFNPHCSKRGGALGVNFSIYSTAILEALSYLVKEKWSLRGLLQVQIDENFINLAKKGEDLTLFDNKEPVTTVNAKSILYQIANANLITYRPGIIFDSKIVAPCGEFACEPNEGIPEASLNLPNFVLNKNFSWEKFRQVIKETVSFLDAMIDVNPYPGEDYKKVCLKNRSIGIGFMGFADICAMLDIKYLSQESLAFLEDLCKILKKEAFEESKRLARLKRNSESKNNKNLFAFSPTGTRCIIGKCSSSIFPYFDEYTSSRLKQTELVNCLKKGTIKKVADTSPVEILNLVEVIEKTLDCRVSYSIFLENSNEEEIVSLIFQAKEKKLKQISFFCDRGQTKKVYDTLEMPKEDI